MTILTIALANLRRRKGKAGFLAAGIALGIGTVVALMTLTGSVRREIGNQLDQFGANIVVLPRFDSLALDYGGVRVSDVSFDSQQLTAEDAARVLEIPYRNRISTVAPKLLGAVNVQGRQALLAGVNFPEELKLKRWWRIAGSKPQRPTDVLVGNEVAVALGIGSEQAARAATATTSADHSRHASAASKPSTVLEPRQVLISGIAHTVTGVIEATAGPEDKMVFAALPHVQTLLGKRDAVSVIEISALCKDCPVEDIVTQIGAQLPHARVSAVQQLVQAREQAVARLTSFSAAVSAVVLAIGGLLIFTSMMGSVVERTREIGVFRAIGFRRSHIVRSLLIEVSVISAVGGFVGWLAGTAVGWATLPYFAEAAARLELRPLWVPLAIGGALIIGIASSVYPIVRASRLDPCEAVRSV